MDRNRRDVLGMMAGLAGAGILTRPVPAGAAVPVFRSKSELWLWRMLRGVPIGEPFFGEWVVMDAYPPLAGGMTIVIGDGLEGAPLRIDVVRRGKEVRAPAYTEYLELYAMDGGGGVTLQPEARIDALQALATQLQDNEAQWLLSEKLLTHTQRLHRYPEFMSRAAAELAPTAPEEDDP